MATQLAVRALFDALFARYGLSAGTFNVLMLLRSEPGPVQPHQVAERLGITRPTVTGLLGTLARRGYIDRRTHPNDRRMALLAIAPAGEAALTQLLPEIAALEQQAFAPLPETDRRTLMTTLTRVREHAERLAAQR